MHSKFRVQGLLGSRVLICGLQGFGAFGLHP